MNNLLSVNQVAFILKVHPLTIRRYIREKKLKALKLGGNIRINENDLADFHKDINSSPPSGQSLKLKRVSSIKQFSEDDPFLRLKGRGASLRLSR